MKFKKIYVVILTTLLLFPLTILNSSAAPSNFVEEKNKIFDMLPPEAKSIVETQNNEYQIVESEIINTFGSLEGFYEYGALYINKQGGVIIGINKEDYKTTELKEKIKKVSKSTKIQYKKIDYNTKNLDDIFEQVKEEVINLKGSKELNPATTVINLDEVSGKVILQLEEDADKAKKFLQNKFGEVLVIETLEPDMIPIQEISRNRNWNKLGGGIYVKDGETGAGSCTTAAVGKKDTRYFLITAGHCLDADRSGVLQITQRVGTDHAIGNGTGIDVGLILLDDTNTYTGGRYATNRFYFYAEDDTDYDRRLSGGWAATMTTGHYLCKSGISTNVTCGSVKYVKTSVDYSDDGHGFLTVARINNDNSFSSDYSMKGDSGAITFDPYNLMIYGVHSGGENPTGGDWTYGFFTRIWDITDKYSSSTSRFTIYTGSTDIKVSN